MTGRPPKTLNDLDVGRQNIHKKGTNEYDTRCTSLKGPPTAWRDAAIADIKTLEAYNKGTVTKTYPDGTLQEIKWFSGMVVGENGEQQITVKIKRNGKIHGFPSGTKKT